jgi:polysaccharide pyruvyl transferase WcaK-like protein
MKKVLYMHGGSGNHGCEAIIRTTAKLLGGPEDVVLWSFEREEDIRYGAARTVERIVQTDEIKKGSPAHIEAMIRRKIFKQPDANFKVFVRKLFKNNVAISVGGDNYCYPWSAAQGAQWGKLIRRTGAKTVLWGCSVEEDAITPEIRADLEQFDLITARETITYQLLKNINSNTVLVADPAFLLEKEKCPLPENFKEGNTVGINVSPMIMDYGDGDIILKNYEELIKYILTETDMNVCLIPHVIWKQNNDLLPVDLLYGKYADSGRICKVDDRNGMELKWVISQCRFFVGARTHATIAAYSTCVPTLVIGYSVKSKGIATDLFGTDRNYVVPVQNLQHPGQLTEAFAWIQSRENEICQKLRQIMPDYINRAWVAKAALEALLKERK